jgi:hypothetical protein
LLDAIASLLCLAVQIDQFGILLRLMRPLFLIGTEELGGMGPRAREIARSETAMRWIIMTDLLQAFPHIGALKQKRGAGFSHAPFSFTDAIKSSRRR